MMMSRLRAQIAPYILPQFRQLNNAERKRDNRERRREVSIIEQPQHKSSIEERSKE